MTSLLVFCSGNASKPVQFADERLEYSIRIKLDRMEGEIRRQDLKSIESLTLLKNVSDLSGIELLENLKTIKSNCMLFSENLINDIRPLASLEHLENIHMPFCEVEDLSPISNMDNLSYINFDSNLIRDASPIASLDNIKNVILDNNSITDLTPFSKLENLEGLLLTNNEIQNLTPIKDADSIQILGIANNRITDLSPLVNLTGLSTLMIYENHFTDITPLLEIYENGGFRKTNSIIMLGVIDPDLYDDYYPVIEALLKRGVNVIFDLGSNG